MGETLRADGLLLPAGTHLLHIGPPKTGTTALQGAFHVHRPEVLAQGVRYAGRARHSGTAVLAVTGRPSFAADDGSPSIGAWKPIVREVRRATEPRILFSSEFLADAAPESIPGIVDDLGGTRVHVVVTLRPLVRIIPSQWQQYVQSGLRTDFATWLDAMLNRPPGKVTPTFWRRHRHDELVARWAEVVGPERVTVIAMDEGDHDQVLRLFEQLLGLRTGTLVAERDVANRSMTMPEIEAVRAFNIAFFRAGLPRDLHGRIVRHGAATHMKLQEPSPASPRIELPAWALDRATAVAEEMVANIGSSGVRVIGNLDGLAAAPSRPAGDTRPDVCVPPEVAASMAMGVLIASGLARTGDGGKLRATGGGRSYFEPLELARVPTYQLAGVVGLRARDTVVRRLRRILGRGPG